IGGKKVRGGAKGGRGEGGRRVTRKDPIQNGKAQQMFRTMSLSKPNESNSQWCHRKRRRIGNTLSRYRSNPKANSTFVWQKVCALQATIDLRKITMQSSPCRSCRAKSRSKARAACWRSAANVNCRSARAL